MGVKLAELEAAAERYRAYDAELVRLKKENKAALDTERLGVAILHASEFLPPSERGAKLQAALATMPASSLAAAAEAGLIPADAAAGAVSFPGNLLVPEVLFGDNDLRPIRFLHVAGLAARSVGRIRIVENPDSQGGDATGFLCAPGLLMTNHHVLPSATVAAAAAVLFDDEEGLDGRPKEPRLFQLMPDVLFVNDAELDYALVAVAPTTGSGTPLAQYGYFRLYEQMGKLDPTQREAVNIIQHPGGGAKKVTLRDNYVHELLPDSVDPAKGLNSLFYGADTLKGSSGAPVCSDQWNVVAVHRGGVPETRVVEGKRVVVRLDGTPAQEGDPEGILHYIANEGTRVSRIFASLARKADKDGNAARALEQLRAAGADPKLGPIDAPTAPIRLPGGVTPEEGGPEEIIRRRASKFEGAEGYRADFLGAEFVIGLPEMTSEVRREVATLKESEETELKYANYSLVMNKERQTAFFAAGNIDGEKLWKNQIEEPMPKRPPWSFDPRMEEKFQPDDEIFSTQLQRGHLFKREDAVWGVNRTAMRRADEHSFTIPNATPMIGNFNNVEWGDLEDIVSKASREGQKISYFAGPIFRATDPFYNELRKNVPVAERRKGMRVPTSFWKIVMWVEDGTLRAAGFILDQADEIMAEGPLEINFERYQQRAIGEIEEATGLRFGVVAEADTFESS